MIVSHGHLYDLTYHLYQSFRTMVSLEVAVGAACSSQHRQLTNEPAGQAKA